MKNSVTETPVKNSVTETQYFVLERTLREVRNYCPRDNYLESRTDDWRNLASVAFDAVVDHVAVGIRLRRRIILRRRFLILKESAKSFSWEARDP